MKKLKDMSLGLKLFLFLLIVLAFSLALATVVQETRSAETAEMLVDRLLEMSRNFIAASIDEQKETALAIARRYARDEQVVAAFLQNDRNALQRIVAPLYHSLNQNNAVTVFEFGDAHGVVFFRGHRPDQFGDDKSSAPSIRMALGGKESSGFAFGKSGLAIRGFAPIFHGNSVVGTLQVGFNLDRAMLSRLSVLVGDIAFFEKDTLVQTTSESEADEVGTRKQSGIYARLTSGEPNVLVDDGGLLSVYLPMPAPEGDAVQGMFRVNQDVSFVVRRRRENVLFTAALFALILSAVAVLVLFAVRYINRSFKNIIGLAERAQNGDLAIAREDFHYEAKDELGRMADALAEMVAKQRVAMRAISAVSEKLGTASEEFAAVAEETNRGAGESRAGVEDVASRMEILAAVSEEQAASSEEIASAVRHIASKAGESASSASAARGRMAEVASAAERVAQGSEELAELSAQLRKLTGAFTFERGSLTKELSR